MNPKTNAFCDVVSPCAPETIETVLEIIMKQTEELLCNINVIKTRLTGEEPSGPCNAAFNCINDAVNVERERLAQALERTNDILRIL